MAHQIIFKTLKAAQSYFNSGKLDAYVDTLYAPEADCYVTPSEAAQDREDVRSLCRDFKAGFPDASLTLDEIVVDGDTVAVRYHLRGTHRGTFEEIPATGRHISVPGMSMMRWQGKQVVELWNTMDTCSLRTQLVS